jgi:hypothetical protein
MCKIVDTVYKLQHRCIQNFKQLYIRLVAAKCQPVDCCWHDIIVPCVIIAETDYREQQFFLVMMYAGRDERGKVEHETLLRYRHACAHDVMRHQARALSL